MSAFITFEGIEGSGKSTQARRLAEALGPETVLTCEPGHTALGRSIRSLLLEGTAVDPAAEALLFFADRAQHVAEVIGPALAAGRNVVSDRYLDSSLAYQGYGRGLPLAVLESAAQLATGGLKPGLTILLDVPVEDGLSRAGRRGQYDRMESERQEFHERVRAGYLRLAAAEPARWLRLDGGQDPDEIAAAVWRAVQDKWAGALQHGLR